MNFLEDLINKTMNHEYIISLFGRVISLFLLMLGMFITESSYNELLYWVVFIACGYMVLLLYDYSFPLMLGYGIIAMLYNPLLKLLPNGSATMHGITFLVIIWLMIRYGRAELKIHLGNNHIEKSGGTGEVPPEK